MIQPKGLFVDAKAWEGIPPHIGNYQENPPNEWEDCEQCGGCHPPGYTGDCRSDVNRWPSEACISMLSKALAKAGRLVEQTKVEKGERQKGELE